MEARGALMSRRVTLMGTAADLKFPLSARGERTAYEADGYELF